MSESVDTGGKGVLSSALLVAAVSGVLLTGFVLKSGPREAGARDTARLVAPEPPALGATIVQEQAQEPIVVEAELPPLLKHEPKAPFIPTRTAEKPVAVPSDPADPLVVKLATRAERDHTRLSKAGSPWTAQLIVACKAETVDRLLASAGPSEKLYVLPARINEDACFRVCFGSYKSSKDAAAALDMPKTLRGKEKINAVEIAKVLL